MSNTITLKPTVIVGTPPAAAAASGGKPPTKATEPKAASAPTAPPASTGTTTDPLEYTKISTTVGATGKGVKSNVNAADVKNIQNALIYLGAKNIEATGKMDANTIAAIKVVQSWAIKDFAKDPSDGINPAIFGRKGEPDGIIQPGRATNKYLTTLVVMKQDEFNAAAAAAASKTTLTTKAGVTAKDTAPPAAPTAPVYNHGLAHTLEGERSGQAIFEGLGLGYRDNGDQNLGIVSGWDQMTTGNNKRVVNGETVGHGTAANIAIGAGEILSGLIRTPMSAPYFALENLDDALQRFTDNSDGGAITFLVKGFQWLIVKPLRVVSAIVSFVGGLVSALFLWDRGGRDLTQRLRDSTDDLAFVEPDAVRAQRLEREQIDRDVDESNRAVITQAKVDTTAFVADKAKQDANIADLKAHIASMKTSIAAEKDAETKATLQTALNTMTKNLAAATKASAADEAKITAANKPAKAPVDDRYAAVSHTIDEINALIRQDTATVASEKPTDINDRAKYQAEIGQLQVMLASQSKVLAGLTPPSANAPTAPSAGTTITITIPTTTTTTAAPKAPTSGTTTTASGASGSTTTTKPSGGSKPTGSKPTTGSTPPPAARDSVSKPTVTTEADGDVVFN